MSEMRRILVWPMIEKVLIKNEKYEIVSLIDLLFVKNLIRVLGLSIDEYEKGSHTYNFNRVYLTELYELLMMIDNETELVQFQTKLNTLPKEFLGFLLTIPCSRAQPDFIQYFSNKHGRSLSLHMLVFFRDSFRKIFTENVEHRDGYYQLLPDSVKLLFVDLSQTTDLDEFGDKLRTKVFVNKDSQEYFWSRVFTVEYGRYI